MTSHKDLPPELEKAVQTLLKPPHIFYLKELHSALQEDGSYIFNNEATVTSAVQQIFAKEGVPWKADQCLKVLAVALHRIEER